MTEYQVPGSADYLTASEYVDSDSPEVQDFVVSALNGRAPSETQTAIRLFEAVRDDLRYDPYTFAVSPQAYRASAIARQDSAFCVPKAILLAACYRAAGIPAAVGFADVRNHLNTPKLAELMGTDLFVYHGYVQLWLQGKPYKVTPAFNMQLCQRFGVKPLVFDGTSDALFHEFDEQDRPHMEYVHDRGLFHDPPVEEFLRVFKQTYPKLEALAQGRTALNGADKFDEGFASGKPGGAV